jgi:chromosomal replication initiator protein
VDQFLNTRPTVGPPTLPSIARATAAHFDVPLSDLRSTSRTKAIVAARGMAIYLARTLAGASLVELGRYFGGRDHTTILHSYRKTQLLMDGDQPTVVAADRLKHSLSSPDRNDIGP